jgi:hypothetical protein
VGLQAALVDRARVVTKRQRGARVEGRTQYGNAYGPWFRCRLQLAQAPETVDPVTGVRPVASEPLLLYGVRDADGNPPALTNQVRVQVDSHELGTGLWDVTADPEPLRKKRRVLGFQAQLRRVEVHEAERVA